MVGVNGFISPCPVGLDYTAVYTIAKTLDIEITPALLYQMQALEFYELNRKPGEGDAVGSE